jgi:hypothetical protein
LPAKASGQPTRMLDVPTPSRASSLPQGIGGVPGSTDRPVTTVGARLAREGVGSANINLDMPTPSRASSLPQGIGGVPGSTDRPVTTVGARLARDGVGSANMDAECADAFASKPAPTGDWRCAWIYGSPSNHCGSAACPRWRQVSQHQCWMCRRHREQARPHRGLAVCLDLRVAQ